MIFLIYIYFHISLLRYSGLHPAASGYRPGLDVFVFLFARRFCQQQADRQLREPEGSGSSHGVCAGGCSAEHRRCGRSWDEGTPMELEILDLFFFGFWALNIILDFGS